MPRQLITVVQAFFVIDYVMAQTQKKWAVCWIFRSFQVWMKRCFQSWKLLITSGRSSDTEALKILLSYARRQCWSPAGWSAYLLYVSNMLLQNIRRDSLQHTRKSSFAKFLHSLRHAEKFRNPSKKHQLVRTFCACQRSPYMLHCAGTIVLQGGWPLVPKGWRWCWWTTIILTLKILRILSCSF